jgi:hypothetical protein
MNTSVVWLPTFWLVAAPVLSRRVTAHAHTPTSQAQRKRNRFSFPHGQAQQGLLHAAGQALARVVQRTNQYGAASHWPVPAGNGQPITPTMNRPCLDTAYKTMAHIHAMNYACLDTTYKTMARVEVF